jgi:hypothetical protein
MTSAEAYAELEALQRSGYRVFISLFEGRVHLRVRAQHHHILAGWFKIAPTLAEAYGQVVEEMKDSTVVQYLPNPLRPVSTFERIKGLLVRAA